MPHAALCVVQPFTPLTRTTAPACFNAARGFVCGATQSAQSAQADDWGVSMPHAALCVVQLRSCKKELSVEPFQCRTRLCEWCSPNATVRIWTPRSFNAARGFVGGAAGSCDPTVRKDDSFQCRTRLCGWCSMKTGRCPKSFIPVSMPHAALWVVQPDYNMSGTHYFRRFNAARGFVGGAA